MAECSLCGQILTAESEYMLNQVKMRHELGRHTRHTVISERDGSVSKPMGNFIYGKVEWK